MAREQEAVSHFCPHCMRVTGSQECVGWAFDKQIRHWRCEECTCVVDRLIMNEKARQEYDEARERWDRTRKRRIPLRR